MPNVFEHCRVVTIMGEANLLPLDILCKFIKN